MPDRVKQAIFDILGSYDDCPGGLPPMDVADVFAGSGSMGIEALSRGAASCCFIERDPIALSALRANLDALKVGPEATIVKGDAWMQIPRRKKGSPDTSTSSERLIFLDPPYDDSDDSSPDGQVMQYLQRLAAGVLPFRAERDRIGVSSVGIRAVAAKRGHLNVMAEFTHQHHAELSADHSSTRKKFQHPLRRGVGHYVIVLWRQRKQHVPHASAGEQRGMAMGAQGLQSMLGGLPGITTLAFHRVKNVTPLPPKVR